MVALYDSALAPLGVFAVNTVPLITFTEGHFSYAGVAVGRAVLDFEDTAIRFAFDNLEYEAVPEPASVLMLGAGLLGMGARRLRRRS
jgi:hypothetical protein